MLNSLTVPVLALLISLPGLGSLPGFRPKISRKAAAADTLPPAWKPASRLALENQFVSSALGRPERDGRALKVAGDPRQVRVSVDPDSDMIRVGSEMGQVSLGGGARYPLSSYSRDMAWESFRRQWQDRSRQSINTLTPLGTTSAAPRTGLQFAIPSPLPKRMQSWLGPGGPALNISGSENIRLSGQSNWSNQQIPGQLGQRRSLFPSLDMQQDLDIRLEGQLSDRVRVNLLQNSGVQIPLANRIAINYKGDEDDLIQALDLGNTNLALPGTQYVSYSGKNEGLFGVKVASKLGPLDLTMLASKQEGRSERASYAGGASKQTPIIYDADYTRGIYFFLTDPNGPEYDIDNASINLYIDDANYTSDALRTRGRALLSPDSLAFADRSDSTELFGRGAVSARGNFKLLYPGPDKDYEVLSDVYGRFHKIIQLKQPIDVNRSDRQVLAVTYRRRLGDTGTFEPVGGDSTADGVGGVQALTMKLLWVHPSKLKHETENRFDESLALARVRDLELRNFYSLGGQRIDPTTMKISIRKGTEQPYRTVVPTQEGQVPYYEILGLDNLNEQAGTPVQGHDEKIDAAPIRPETRAFVDYENGVLFFYDLRPFAPRPDRFFEGTLSDHLNRRANLRELGEANDAIYDRYTVERNTDPRFYIDVEFSAARATGEITLGRSNIVEGSEVVTINGRRLLRDQDYTVDYDLGRVVLKTTLGATDNLNVDYAYAPLFAQAGKTLLGSAFRYEGKDRSFGGAFLYESKGAQDLRPRLGEEPSRTLIGDLNSDVTFRPTFLTRLIDGLPGVRTTAPSEFRVNAEVGASLPNPNTRNEIYIDDMEGVRDAVSLSMSAERWRYGSVPSRTRRPVQQSLLEDEEDGELIHNAEIHWYSPYSVVKEYDLKPTLEDAQGAQNSHQILALSIPRRPTIDADPSDKLWASLTYPLSEDGIDVEKAQFIELWVNDFRDQNRIRGPGVKLHLDLGVVSEDQMRSPNIPPNGVIDTEDKGNPPDGKLVIAEDTGVDGVENAGETAVHDLLTAGPGDPEGDDYGDPVEAYRNRERDPRRWLRINGTQGNRLVVPYPDTEDTDGSTQVEDTERFFQYTIDLADTSSSYPYLGTDVYAEFAGKPLRYAPKPDNGWRRYRIPVNDPARGQVGAPDLKHARHVRLWIENVTEPDGPLDAAELRPLLEIGGIDIVGSRWRLIDTDPQTASSGATVTLNAVNSVDNADIYVAPFDPGETRTGNQGLTRREQSIALEFEDLAANDTLEAFRSFSIDENYSRYGKLDWFVTGFDVQGASSADSLEYFVRFASDEQGETYYEYRAPLPRSASARGVAWREVRLDLTEMSDLKFDPSYGFQDTVLVDSVRVVLPDTLVRPSPSDPAATLITKGRPSFTRLRRISFGLINRSAQTLPAGQLWFNEVRAIDVAKDRGRAQRVNISGQASNLLSYSFVWDGRSADFLQVGETRGSGSSRNDIQAGTTLQLHRFFEASGIVLPLTFGYGRNLSQPRFTAGEDVVRSGALVEASESFSENRSWTTSYSRNWSERSNPLLRYTLGGITANMQYTDGKGHNPNQLDRRWSRTAAVSYQVAPRRLLSIPVPWTKTRVLPLPERFFWNYDVSKTWSQTTDRIGLFTGDFRERAPVSGRQANIRFGADTRPIESFSHHFEGVRNLMLGGSPKHLGFIYLGRVVTWGQTMNARFALNRGSWLSPTLNWSSRYNQDNLPNIDPNLSQRSINNGQSVQLGWNLPFDRLARASAVTFTAPPTDSTQVAAPKKKRGFSIRDWLARVGNVQTDASFNWGSNLSRLKGTPSLFYLVGLTQDPTTSRTSLDPNNVSNKSYEWKAGARSKLTLFLGSSIQTSADVSSRQTDASSVSSRRDDIRFPDLQVDYGNIANAVGLKKLLQNPRLRTSFNSSLVKDFSNGLESSRGYESRWQPFLGLSGELKNGTRVEFQADHRSTRNIRSQLGRSTTTTGNTDVSLNVNRSYTQGQKMNLLGKETTVKSTINLGLSTKYERETGKTLNEGDTRPRSPNKQDRLSVNSTGSYQFSNNVTGNVELGFGQNRDLETKITRRNVRVQLRGTFTF